MVRHGSLLVDPDFTLPRGTGTTSPALVGKSMIVRVRMAIHLRPRGLRRKLDHHLLAGAETLTDARFIEFARLGPS